MHHKLNLKVKVQLGHVYMYYPIILYKCEMRKLMSYWKSQGTDRYAQRPNYCDGWSLHGCYQLYCCIQILRILDEQTGLILPNSVV